MSETDQAAPNAAEARREIALRLAVELLRGRDNTAGHATRAARLFETYLLNGTVER